MGYSMHCRETDFKISKAQLAKFKKDHKKPLARVLESTGWHLKFDKAEDRVLDIDFCGENYHDEDDEIMDMLAPYVAAGSYIQMQGDEGELWRWVFDGLEVRKITPTITWPE